MGSYDEYKRLVRERYKVLEDCRLLEEMIKAQNDKAGYGYVASKQALHDDLHGSFLATGWSGEDAMSYMGTVDEITGTIESLESRYCGILQEMKARCEKESENLLREIRECENDRNLMEQLEYGWRAGVMNESF